MNQTILSSNLERGLVLLTTTTVSILLLLICVCFKRNKGLNLTKESRNGQVSKLSRRLSETDHPENKDGGIRNAVVASHRRLPDIPDPDAVDVQPVPSNNSVRSSQDNTSELYAQVDMGPFSDPSLKKPLAENIEEPSAVSNGTLSPVALELESTNPTHSYDKVKSTHGYSKIKKKGENPYAKVKRTDPVTDDAIEVDENETDTDNYDVVYTPHGGEDSRSKTLDHHSSKSSVPEPSPFLPPPLPPPERGSHSSLLHGEFNHLPRPPPRGRRGHSAVIGYLSTSSASNIMNRPSSLVLNPVDIPNSPDVIDGFVQDVNFRPDVPGVDGPQIHFSGDSQASQDSKGYSSISVREPLANLKASSQATGAILRRVSLQRNEILDPHYATVSDAEDSDEMYAAIADPPPMYVGVGGSDTYAKINDRISDASLPNTVPAPSLVVEAERNDSPVPPTPPPVLPSVVSLKQLSNSSSRLHASTLSIASQTSAVGSPKPEKRQANSPLPPPPFHDSGEADRNRKSFNVEEMYAKVIKKKGLSAAKPFNLNEPVMKMHLSQHRGSVDLGLLTGREDEASNGNSNSRRNSVDATPSNIRFDISDNVAGNDVVAVPEELSNLHEDDEEDLRYEVLPVQRTNRKISESDPGYEKIQLKNEDSFNDPRYERIRPKKEEHMEPNYEVVCYKRTHTISESSEPGYEEVKLETRGFQRDDPNYESLHYTANNSSDPPYAKVNKEDAINEEVESLNNNFAIPVYAQVVKPKKTNSIVITAEPSEITTTQIQILQDEDFSVSSSENTTIIRITDNGPAFRYFPESDSLGIPEQV